MTIDPRYVAALDLQQYLVTKNGAAAGFPLAAGQVFFFQDANRTNPKPVYQISGNFPDYTFAPLPNPMILSAVGTTADADGNDVIPYYFPYLSDGDNTIDLYYIEVYDSQGNLQFTRVAWPPNITGEGQQLPNIPNFVPNGQFLVHNTINPFGGNTLSGGDTPIAQGGWYIELPPEVASMNTLIFLNNSYSDSPPESPPFILQFSCITPNGSDTFKNIGLRFDDVNKFTSDTEDYTLGFWASAGSNTNVTIQINKYFGVGGTTNKAVPIETITITEQPQFFSIGPFDFGNNEGFTYGSGTTYIEIQWACPVDSIFAIEMTDVVLGQTTANIEDFPVQTDADTYTRTLPGWIDNSVNNGYDLYLPMVKTLEGMTFDYSQIGRVEGMLGAIVGPNSTEPLPIGNQMPADGTSYLMEAFSTIGIPFSRFGNYLIDNSAVAGIPMFGTGANFATAYTDAGNLSSLRLTVNTAGSIAAASNPGYSSFTISAISAGLSSTLYRTGSTVADTFIAYNTSGTGGAADNGTTSFTVTIVNTIASNTTSNGLVADQNFAFTCECTAASIIANPGGAGRYWDFDNGTTGYRMWFQITNETAPAAGGNTLMQVNLQATDTAQDVSNIVREAAQGSQLSLVIINTVPLQSEYWAFTANPTSPTIYNVVYQVGTTSPAIPPSGISIIVVLDATGETTETVVTKTNAAINSYQYAAPDLRGMYLRGADFTGIWDFDVAQRSSIVTGISGANYGTFEYSQLQEHHHYITGAFAGISTSGGGAQYFGNNGSQVTGTYPTGGSETRTVNTYVQWVVRY